MDYYTRTTIIQPHIKIRRERTLPKSGEVVVGVGQDVTPNLVVARTPLETHFAIVDASEILGVTRDKVPDFMMVEKEAIVDIDTVLAQKKKLFRTRQLLAPEEGVLFEVVNGRVVIQQTSEWLEKQAMVAGRVVSYVADRGVIIETQGTLIQGAWGSGKESFGQLKTITRKYSDPLRKEQLSHDSRDLILVAGRLEQLEILEMAADSDVKGIIAGSMPAELCQAATSLPFPIILTDGIGKQNMTAQIFNLLQQADGQEASLFGDYDEPKGQRPEIIIPQPTSPTTETVSANKPIRVGQPVRLLRPPFMGQIGEVVKIYSLSQMIGTGAKAKGVDIQLSDGNVVFVPNANFDVII